jgi:uracil-DNA glycosylase family 4
MRVARARTKAIVHLMTLSQLNKEIIECKKCPRLVEWRESIAIEKRASFRDEEYWGKPVPSFGDPNAKLLIIGLAPAAHGANRTGRMFTGDRSGDFLFSALHRAGYATQPNATSNDDGMELNDAYITAPVRCAPPQNKPTAEEQKKCSDYLKREFRYLQNIKVILALGLIGYTAISKELNVTPRPKFRHGLEVELDSGEVILCSYHVSQQNTFTGRLTVEMFDEVLERAKEISAEKTYKA